jgi:hypothetical protein
MIAWHSPLGREWTANQNRTAEKAFAANFDMKFSAEVFLSAAYGHIEAYQSKTVPRVRIPLTPPRSLDRREIYLRLINWRTRLFREAGLESLFSAVRFKGRKLRIGALFAEDFSAVRFEKKRMRSHPNARGAGRQRGIRSKATVITI